MRYIGSVQFSRSVVSNFLRPHELQHARLPCLSLTPRACSNLYPSSWWCHPSISSSVVPFSCLQLESFPKSWLFTSGGQNIGISASVLPMNIQDWFPLGVTDLISLQSKGRSWTLFEPQFEEINSLVLSLFLLSSSHIYLSMTTGKTIALTIWTFVGKVKSLLFNTLSRFVIAFLPRRKHLLISWLQSPTQW